MDQKTSFIAIAGTTLLMGILLHAIIGLTDALSSSSSSLSSPPGGNNITGNNITGSNSNMTAGSITANPSDNSGSASTGGGLGNCGYSVAPTSNCGTTGGTTGNGR
jgi:hypothetical protein